MAPKSEAEVIGTRQHYIPQAYLRAWSVDPIKRPEMVWGFRLRDGKVHKVNTKNVCQEKGFFDYTGTDGLQHSYDPSVVGVEGLVLEALEHFRRSPTITDLQDAMPSIARLGAMLLLSNAGYRQNVQHLPTAVNEAHGTPIVTASDQSIRNHHVLVMWQHVPQVAEIMMSKRPILVHTHTNTPFWTSDCPVAITNAENRSVALIQSGIAVGILSNAMLLKDPEAIAWFPLSPTLLLMLVPDVQTSSYTPKPEICFLDDQVLFANRQQVYSANRYVFSNKADFTFAKSIRQSDPRLQGEPRRRFRVTKVEVGPTNETGGN